MVVELPRHGVEAFAAVTCHGIDITDEAARETVDDVRVKGLVCSFSYSRVGRAGGIGRWSLGRWHSSVQGVVQGIAIRRGARTGVGELGGGAS